MKKKIILSFVLTIACINTLFAQGGDPGPPPCDADQPCPIDTWIVLFAAAALVVTIIHLHRKQKLIGKTA
jgi:hypothetical protein